MLEKSQLKKGSYYYGGCRNADTARWDGERFWYWREKFGGRFLEDIGFWTPEGIFNEFQPEREIDYSVPEIPLGEE